MPHQSVNGSHALTELVVIANALTSILSTATANRHLPSIVNTGSKRLTCGLRPPALAPCSIIVKSALFATGNNDKINSPASCKTTQITTDLSRAELSTKMVAARLPASRASRVAHYSRLGLTLGLNTLRHAITGRTSNSASTDKSYPLKNADNLQSIVSTLSRMRGAALKLGQMLSIQDADVLPREWSDMLVQLQNHAYYVPFNQIEPILERELGHDWRSLFTEFEQTPRAAASIGQVHYATLRVSGSTTETLPVAVKVQYPNIAKSIASDLATLRLILLASRLLPRGLFLERTLEVARAELELECDYRREADMMNKFATLLNRSGHGTTRSPAVYLPKVFKDVSTRNVLITEWINGIPFGQLQHPQHRQIISQSLLNQIGCEMLALCLQEIFHYRLMQTDPNWSNFLYDHQHNRIVLLDFGSTKEFGEEFVERYRRLLVAAVDGDEDAAAHWSKQLGYLTGYESRIMLNAHLASLFTLAEPFRRNQNSRLYDFGTTGVTRSVRAHIPTMLEHRLTPPPQETYTLHRKLSGIFLLCQKFGCNVDAAALFDEYVR